MVIHWGRVYALLQYYLLLFKKSPPLMFILAFWPCLELALWGFTIFFIQQSWETSFFLKMVLGASFFWAGVILPQQEFTSQVLEDINSRNFTNLLVTPLRLSELLLALFLGGILKFIFVSIFIIAFSFVMFQYNLFQFGLWILPFSLNLFVSAWIMGIVVLGFILRFGRKFDFLSPIAAALIQPFSCVLYAREILPKLFYYVSYLNPVSYIFEGIRAYLVNNLNLVLLNLVISFGLNLIYFVVAYHGFRLFVRSAMKKGMLTTY